MKCQFCGGSLIVGNNQCPCCEKFQQPGAAIPAWVIGLGVVILGIVALTMAAPMLQAALYAGPIIGLIVLINLPCIIACDQLAKAKGWPAGNACLLGLFGGIVAVIAYAGLPNRR